MPVQLEPLKPVRCTFSDCANSFVSDEQMRHHKMREHEFEYCHRCDEDFEDYNDLIFHKIARPNEHKRACRVCGDEFVRTEALKRHIELNHKVKHTLVCPGCTKSFYRPVLFIEHLEYNHCSVIPAQTFVKHIIHKQLTFELLNNDEAMRKFDLKQAKYDATQDLDTEGGISIEVEAFDDEATTIEYKAMEPDVVALPEESMVQETFPPLPSQMSTTQCELGFNLSELSLSASTAPTTLRSSVLAETTEWPNLGNSVHEASSINGSTATISTLKSNVWGSRSGKSSSTVLFPNAKPAPIKEEFSITAYDQEMEKAHGVNAWKERFWDPDAEVYNAERFYDAITTKYYCPFVCDLTLDTVADLNCHIRQDHKIDRMKCLLCCKYFQSATALMAHCEALNSRCKVGKTANFGIFLDRFTGGFLGVRDEIRPDHLNNPATLVQNLQTGRTEPYRPPTASYLQYSVTTPPDYEQPVKTFTVTGGHEQKYRSLNEEASLA